MINSLYDLTLERELIGLLINVPNAQRVIGRLSADDFSRASYATIFTAMIGLQTAHKPIDLITINEMLAAMHSDGAMQDAVEAATNVFTGAVNIDQYVYDIKRYTKRRKLRNILQQIQTEIIDAGKDIDELLDTLRTSLSEISSNGLSVEDTTAANVAIRAYMQLQKLMAGEIKPLKCGNRVDELIGGLYPGELMIIGARPATGKSAYALDLARKYCLEGNAGVLATLEMNDIQMMYRMFSADALINGMHIREARLNDDELGRLADSLATISARQMLINQHVRTVGQLRTTILDCREKYGHCEYAVVDYLQLMEAPNGTKNRYEEISGISRQLKQLALEQNISIIALSQLRRPDPSQITQRPRMSDLRESGQIEQDADQILLLYRMANENDSDYDVLRDIYTNIEQSGHGIIEVIVSKSRAGQTGTVALEFVPEYMLYKQISLKK